MRARKALEGCGFCEEDSAGRRGRTLRAGAGIGPEVPCASEAPAGRSEAARRWRRWEVVNSATVDDFRV